MDRIITELAEEVHASAVLDLIAASWLWQRCPRLAHRYVEQATDQLRTALPVWEDSKKTSTDRLVAAC